MRILKGIILFFAIVGCLSVSLTGYYIYSGIKSGKFQLRNPLAVEKPAEQTSAPLTSANPETDAILRAYQKAEPTPTPAAMPGQPAAAQVAVSRATPAPTATPAVPTPGPDVGLIREWPTGRKWVALTFDDGPHPEWTPKFMELLKAKNVKATFFLIGPNIEKNPETARLLATSGFEVGNHTMTHPQFRGSSVDKIMQELSDTNHIMKTVIGIPEVNLMRPPFGMAPKNVQQVCGQLGLKIIGWNIDTADWDRKSTEEDMVENIMKNLRDGCIILMHDRYEKSYNTTARVIDQIQAKGLEFVTVGELLGLKPYIPGGLSAMAAQSGAPQAASADVPTAQQPLAAPGMATPTPNVSAAPQSAAPMVAAPAITPSAPATPAPAIATAPIKAQPVQTQAIPNVVTATPPRR